MKVGIISDIHGNLPALDAVLADVAGRRVDAIYCLGDLVGYGPFPNEVTDRIRAGAIPTVMGNYDDGVGFDRDECGCVYGTPVEQERGLQSLAWTRARVTEENKAFLRTLPSEIRIEQDGTRILLVHGSPQRMNEYLFEGSPIARFQGFAASSGADIIAFGHTHRPYSTSVDDVRFVNAGSVGLPKDGDWRACYVILNTAAAEPVEFVRVPYDAAGVAAVIRASELSDAFANLIEGRPA